MLVCSNATFTATGGTISGNSAESGGGVYVDGGAFTMDGGTISGNAVEDWAGGVSVYYGGAFTMAGGTISGNGAIGVDVYSGGTFTMTGGTISGNLDSGVYVGCDGSSFTMDGGTISGNETDWDGSGVYVDEDGTFTMNGGTISGNTAYWGGGGVYVYYGGTMTVSGTSVISGNTNSTGVADNVHLLDGNTIALGELAAGASIGVTTETMPTEGSPVTIATGATAADVAYFTSDNFVCNVEIDGTTLCLVARMAIPSYLRDVDVAIVSNYVAWAERYGPDVDGTHKTAFLLDIDPATPISEGAALLKITGFTVNATQFILEVGSDVTEFTDKGNGATTPFLGNGYLGLYSSQTPSDDPDDWMPLGLVPVQIRNGRGVVDLSEMLPYGSIPSSLFFKATIETGPFFVR